ncbi:urease subunit beta [Cellulomonas xiejunii]|uniref:Urease subunit beta n=1 Tax=Cellulomonas xiejunii TaxID=2968083 RepID=A0ABY5KUU9_9CELL|nr:urease subunit beta [Cellulomonas xiejunii]MCC2314729.1 urease subunit beta [Cellulomonas xiejunii]MCC2322991.1 urease subunit beta [Cellulomonas xiejunii]UUI73488.1 urease subunit beta [Cellulomonas xiejunii]
MLGSPKYHHHEDDIEINANRAKVKLRVSNTGDRAVQIGSHFHFFEANRALLFEREKAYGMHLDIPAGTGVRIEPGDTREVTLAAYGGGRRLYGFNNLVDGGLDSRQKRLDALRRLAECEFKDGTPAAPAPSGKKTTAPSGKKTTQGRKG